MWEPLHKPGQKKDHPTPEVSQRPPDQPPMRVRSYFSLIPASHSDEPPVQMKRSEGELRAELEQLPNADGFKRLATPKSGGTGVNKTVLQVDGDWVLLLSKSPDLIAGETASLRGYARDLDVPETGEPFQVTYKGSLYYAFLEEFVPGFEAKQPGKLSISLDDIRSFADKVLCELSNVPDKGTRTEKYQNALESIRKLQDKFRNDEFAIPDLQFRYDQNTGRILVIDPGDRSSQATHSTQVSWIKELDKVMKTKSYKNPAGGTPAFLKLDVD